MPTEFAAAVAFLFASELIFVQPVTGFHVASVHSIEDLSAMRFAFDANRTSAGVSAGSAN